MCCLIVLFANITEIIAISGNYTKNSFCISALRYIIHLEIVPFFLPLMSILLSGTNCEGNKNYFNKDISCFLGVFYLYFIIGIICSLIVLVNGMFYSITYYLNSMFNPDSEISKISSSQDYNLIIGKTLFILIDLYIVDKSSDLSQWISIVLYLIISLYLFASCYIERPSTNTKLLKIQLASLSIFSWGNLVILINKIFEKTNYNGGIWLFLAGSVLLLIYYYYFEVSFLSSSFFFKQNMNEVETLHKINLLINLIENKELSRNKEMLLKGYIYLYEEKCHIEECPLKKFLRCDGQDTLRETVKYFFLHIEILFKNSIEKFPNSKRIRIAYCFFLLSKLKKRYHSLIELEKCENLKCTVEEEYLLFIFKKFIDGYEEITIKKTKDTEHDIILYKKEFTRFKNEIKKVSLIYGEFWSILLFSNKGDLERLSKIGKKINLGIKEINKLFNNLQEIKPNDKDVLVCYVDFLVNVVHDKETLSKYKQILYDSNKKEKDISNSISFTLDNFSVNPSNNNISDLNQYLVLSSQPESFGIITNISLGLCISLGFSRNEVIGRNYDICLPEIFVKNHNTILKNRSVEFRKEFIDLDYSSSKYKGKDIDVFFVSKSKYLVPMTMKVGIIPNEAFDFSFIGKINNSKFSMQNETTKECYVLTNKDYIIQNFTANAISLLGLDSRCINGNLGIIEFIKEFYEEFLKCVIENENKSHDQRVNIRNKIIKTKYTGKNVLITWKNNALTGWFFSSKKIMLESMSGFHSFQGPRANKASVNNLCEIDKDSNILGVGATTTIGNNSEATKFFLNVTEQRINKELVGFVFKFSTIPVNRHTSTLLKEGVVSVNTLLKSTKIINNDYIPPALSKFQLDVDNLSYKCTFNNNTAETSLEEKRTKMRELVLEKLQALNPKRSKSSSSLNSSNDYTSSSGTSNEEEEEEEKESVSSTNSMKKKTKAKLSSVKEEEKDDYYHVDMSNIKYSIYDYKKRTVVVIDNYEKISQVEEKTAEKSSKNKGTNDENATTVDSSTNIHSFLSYNNSSALGNKNPLLSGDKNQTQVILRKIDKALSKQESQPTIVNFQKASTVTILILLMISVAFLILHLQIFDVLAENVIIIQKSNQIIQDLLFGQFFVRELTLLYHQNFTNYQGHREQTVAKNQEEIERIYNSSKAKINYIITTNVPFSKDVQEQIDKEDVILYSIKKDYSVSFYNVTLYTALEEINTALYHVSNQNITLLYPTNRNVFTYLRNSYNSVFNAIQRQNVYFKEQFDYLSDQYKMIVSIVFGGSILLIIGCYIMLSITYSKVSVKKESYLEVFFDINKKIIQIFLENCESFNKKIQDDVSNDSTISSNEYLSEDLNALGDLNENIPSQNSPTKKGTSNEDSSDKSHISLNQQGGNQIQYIKKHKSNNSKSNLMLKLKLLLVLVLIMIYLSVQFALFIGYLNSIDTYIIIYQLVFDLYTISFKFYNSLREYLFDSTIDVYEQPGTYFTSYFIPHIFEMIKEKETILYDKITTSNDKIGTYLNEINEQSLCQYYSNYYSNIAKIDDKLSCESLLYGSGQFGLKSLQTSFIEDIRYMKDLFDLYIPMRIELKFQYNLTLLGTATDKLYWPSNPAYDVIYFKLNQIRVFNWEKTREINICLLELLKPICEGVEEYIEKKVNEMIKEKKVIMMWMSIGIMIFNVIWFFGFFVPFVNRLNQTIYKAKNMLVIIPRHVLINVPNILSVLNIDTNIVSWNKNNEEVKY